MQNSNIFTFLLLLFGFNSIAQQPQPFENSHSQIKRLRSINPSYDKILPEDISSFWVHRTISQSRDNEPWTQLSDVKTKSQTIDFYVSGRALNIEYINDSLTRIGTASGGLWEARGQGDKRHMVNITEHQVPSPWIGAMATSPLDQNTILIGTGEPWIKYGAGAWITYDGGIQWTQCKLPTFSGSFHKAVFSKVKGKVWLAGEGCYYSKDNGLSWTETKRWNITNIVIDPVRPDTALIGVYGEGVYKTYNGGETWDLLQINNELVPGNLKHIDLANSSNFPNVVYASFCGTENGTKAVMKSIDFGKTWTKCNIIDGNGQSNSNVHLNMCWYASYLSVSPTNPDHAAVGGFWSAMTFDGQNFHGLSEPIHADMHGAAWSPDGSELSVATDGGVYNTKYNLPFDWKFTFNNIPTLQFASVAVSKVNPDIILGGTQDNGIIYYDNNKDEWQYELGDGGGVATHPTKEDVMFGTLGVYGGGLTFRNLRREGGQWWDTNNGIENSGQWFRDVASIGTVDGTFLVTGADNKLYFSGNEGNFWFPINGTSFDCGTIDKVGISNEEQPKIYFNCSTSDQFNAGYIVDTKTWQNELLSYELPVMKNVTFPQFYMSSAPNQAEFIYVVMRGWDDGLNGKHIYKASTTDLIWENITNNLPKAPYTCMLMHPFDSNVLIASTDGFGIYRSEDGGNSWQAWDSGFPRGATVTAMDYQIKNDSAFAVVATYGRGILKKYLGKGNVIITKEETNYNLKLYNNESTLVVECSQCGLDRISLYDLQGRSSGIEVQCTPNELKYTLDIDHLNHGIYILNVNGTKGKKTYKIVK